MKGTNACQIGFAVVVFVLLLAGSILSVSGVALPANSLIPTGLNAIPRQKRTSTTDIAGYITWAVFACVYVGVFVTLAFRAQIREFSGRWKGSLVSAARCLGEAVVAAPRRLTEAIAAAPRRLKEAFAASWDWCRRRPPRVVLEGVELDALPLV
ncbi:hypothetical protein NUU61_002671 [Penicillium alfredii]|uniref:Uncharacterized protein n=1 Tax=Penicillium alfredii TaxID=1506179 RepID=A0A9W9FRZ5_9EURO|nr:uncharacterized protein NUU61_002671 [Penicillium alfredii]KAJ5105324.1 hypothetical protein NUU61_002671 [Penicillium alfredii]